MPTTKKQVSDAIWSSDVGFVCDTHFTDAQLPGASATSEPYYDRVLAGSGRLPDLNGAPVASWVLARLARLASRRFPYEQGQVFGSDGGDFWFRFIAFTSELRPLGTLTVLGGESSVKLWAQISPASESQRVISAFTACLLAEPQGLARCQLTVAYTDFADPNHWKRLPFVFGWDGQRFLARHAPEHAVSPEDFE
jgi:hypothetical protein